MPWQAGRDLFFRRRLNYLWDDRLLTRDCSHLCVPNPWQQVLLYDLILWGERAALFKTGGCLEVEGTWQRESMQNSNPKDAQLHLVFQIRQLNFSHYSRGFSRYSHVNKKINKHVIHNSKQSMNLNVNVTVNGCLFSPKSQLGEVPAHLEP